MKLSVIIINYNVEYFLEQCLYAVSKAIQGIEAEVFVVDNNSVDGSVRMVKEKFPYVRLIENKTNAGFSKANNIAIAQATGEYLLLLNPDTLVEDKTFTAIIDFMDSHPDAGGLGVKMIDGKGNFLPESKRGLPTPAAALYKVTGLSRLFPKSRIFNKYHLGYLDVDEIHEVEILSGAFMLLRKKVLDKIGALDEAFFMYGEDIDLSYRIIKAGYKNYYFPQTRIIHYKGESTKKSSVNYVIIFYNAMLIFAKKHFSTGNARLFSVIIKLAIYLKATLAILSRFLKKMLLPLLDAATIITGIYLLKNYWELNVIAHKSGYYPTEYMTIIAPAYVFVWLISVFLAGGYDKPVSLRRLLKGLIVGSAVILISYSLLSESVRYSRALILLGAVWATVSLSLLRYVLHLLFKSYRLGSTNNKRFAIVGSKEEASRVENLVRKTHYAPAFIGSVNASVSQGNNGHFIGNISQLKEIIEVYKIDEVIFCAKNLTSQQIIDNMAELQHLKADYKIAPPESLYIIGSSSINSSGEIYVVDLNSITKAVNKRNKRLVDIVCSLFFLLTCPFIAFFVKKPFGLLKNIFSVASGQKSWVGYATGYSAENQKLPVIRKGVLTPADSIRKSTAMNDFTSKLNILYARDYKIQNDINILIKGFRNLGRQ